MKRFSLVVIFLWHFFLLPQRTESKAQYVEPLNSGMKMSINFDIANLFKKPIAGAISTVLAVGLAAILFFGVITSPFGYMFGIPSRKYVLGGDSNLFPPPESARSIFSTYSQSNFTADNVQATVIQFLDRLQDEFYPDFLDSMFSWMPQSDDMNSDQCRLLTVCQAHGALPHLPRNFLKIYHKFSHKLAGIPSVYKKAILIGIRDESTCPEYFPNCEDNNAFTIALKTYLNFIPESWKHSFKNTNRRKGAMYMPQSSTSQNHPIKDEL